MIFHLDCSAIKTPPLSTSILSIIIVLGVILSYIPQHYRIILKKSSEGISPWFLLLGITSTSDALINILILQYPILKCCQELGPGKCFIATLGIAQIAMGFLMFTIIVVLVTVYPAHEQATLVSLISLVHFIVLIILSLFLQNRTGFANVIGIISAVLAVCQYVPQIMTTYKRKNIGSLSIPMMLLQTPGSFIFVLSLLGREGVIWSTWAIHRSTPGHIVDYLSEIRMERES
ncbi:hypothetical protein NEOLI_000887 [Neolecta irregularis DAH-3]|uniref:Uncharacterized protein n=1 Tax=Neolecta irregularis (strain DAH-3) TaxID=1198029 RepID=A0A1U7LUZ0_NEOID|nr:hypothetical protein NEOLI_000887 [Neolecta irregularis DAH-3]|eukprot:OLL26331.1 hypothetical protein NEOLI_000887 [Neolecta irregularis DAH-3]